MKYCKMCGCIMEDDHDGEICECCLDDMTDVYDIDDKSMYDTKMISIMLGGANKCYEF